MVEVFCREFRLNPLDHAAMVVVPLNLNLPSCAMNDTCCTGEVPFTAPSSVACLACNHVVPLYSMRTHLGRHILRHKRVADAAFVEVMHVPQHCCVMARVSLVPSY